MSVKKTVREKLNKRKPNFEKSFVDYAIKWPKTKTGEFMCRDCYGSGRVLAPNAMCDPVEGYKFAERVQCTVCHGTGAVDKSRVKTIYSQQKETYKKKLHEWQKLKAKVTNALCNVEENDLKVLVSLW